MTTQRFFFQLATVAAGASWALFLLNQLENLQSHSSFSWLFLAFFTVLSIGMYFAGKKAAGSKNKNDFTSVALGFTIAKLFCVVLIVFFYNKIVQPESNLFILPFLVIYVIFTIYETYFMMQLGKMHK